MGYGVVKMRVLLLIVTQAKRVLDAGGIDCVQETYNPPA